jgi:hypothetical protein
MQSCDSVDPLHQDWPEIEAPASEMISMRSMPIGGCAGSGGGMSSFRGVFSG